jgi:iron-sulfur cluster insertion protein
MNAGALEPAPGAPHPVSMDMPVSPLPAADDAPAPIDFTAAAAAKVRELIREEGNPALKLRVYIQGGGCSGFQYGFEFDDQQSEDDLALVTDEVTLVVDPLSLQYLVGAQVDYTESLHGAQFVIRNPNAKTTCGCGSSFSA